MTATFRAATPDDFDDILGIIGDAQESLRSRGINQWQNGYPNRQSFINDFNNGVGFVTVINGKAIAYAAIIFTSEAAYANLEDGQWLSDSPYVVVHRLCVKKEHTGSGIAAQMMQHAIDMALERGIYSFRIDTHPDNQFMLNMLEKFGFTRCGIIRYFDGIRIAFEKKLV